jgi:hypothetical protein
LQRSNNVKRSFLYAVIAAIAAVLAGCTSTGKAYNPPGGIGVPLSQALFVADLDTGSPYVVYFAPPYTGSAKTTVSSGLKQPYGIQFDAKGDLWVADSKGGTGTGSVLEYASPYTALPKLTITTDMNGPIFLAFNKSGDLFVGNCGGSCVGSGAGNVLEFAPPYTGTPTIITTGTDGPDGVAVDGSGNLFVSNYGGGNVTEYAAPYTGSPTATISTLPERPYQITLDATGDLFVGSTGGVLEFAPPYTGSPTTINGGNESFGVAVDSSNQLFTSTAIAGKGVLEFAPPYTGTPVATISNGLVEPVGLAWRK